MEKIDDNELDKVTGGNSISGHTEFCVKSGEFFTTVSLSNKTDPCTIYYAMGTEAKEGKIVMKGQVYCKNIDNEYISMGLTDYFEAYEIKPAILSGNCVINYAHLGS